MQNIYNDQEGFCRYVTSDIWNVIQVAYEHGIGSGVRAIYLAALQHGLGFAPYRETEGHEPTLGITLPYDHGCKLLRIRMRPEFESLRLYIDANECLQAYQITEDEIAEHIGEVGWLRLAPQEVTQFIERFHSLFELIESRHGKQITFLDIVDGFPSEQVDKELADASPSSATPDVFVEGALYEIAQVGRERNRKAREECLRKYGKACLVCGMDFEATYGPAGAGVINVHHITPLASFDEEHEVSPTDDLVPVCPNCHAMLHRTDPPYTIDALKRMIQQQAGR